MLLSHPGCLWHVPQIVSGAVKNAPQRREQSAAMIGHAATNWSARIAAIYNSISSFQATVDMTPSTAAFTRERLPNTRTSAAYVLFREPLTSAIIGQSPVVRTKAFDMVSDGQRFHILIPPKNLFVEGAQRRARHFEKQLENLRPEAFLSSMLIRPADRDGDADAGGLRPTKTTPSIFCVLISKDAGRAS